MITRPLLAETVKDFESLKYPLIGSAKLDGIRCLMIDGKLVSRKFKPIPNDHIKESLERILPNNIDGELLIRGKETNFNATQSEVMTKSGTPDFVFHAFDYVKDSLDKPFIERIEDLKHWHSQNLHKFNNLVELVPQIIINSVDELLKFEEKCVSEGFEGVMLRSPQGVYKCNRSTLKEGILLKIKRFIDSEAVITGFEERQHNTNSKEVNDLGLSKRSSHKANMVGKNTLGKFICTDIYTGWKLKVGTGEGLTDELRKEIWGNQEKYIGKIFTYKYQKEGMKEGGLPRFLIWKGFRDEIDLS